MYDLDQGVKNKAREIIKEFRPRTGWDWDETFPNKNIKDFFYNHIKIPFKNISKNSTFKIKIRPSLLKLTTLADSDGSLFY